MVRKRNAPCTPNEAIRFFDQAPGDDDVRPSRFGAVVNVALIAAFIVLMVGLAMWPEKGLR